MSEGDNERMEHLLDEIILVVTKGERRSHCGATSFSPSKAAKRAEGVDSTTP